LTDLSIFFAVGRCCIHNNRCPTSACLRSSGCHSICV